ncbi:MAG: penicillin acylase family protein [Acidobacteriota bacterium]
MVGRPGGRRWRWGPWIALAAVALLGLLILATAWGLWRATRPRRDGRWVVQGLGGAVRIGRDAAGIPHVEAGTENDAWFATGFVHGQDRLFQMDVARRAVAGRLAELFGDPAVPLDRWARRHQHQAAASAMLDRATPREREALQAYADGVNAAVSAAISLPPEYHLLAVPFEPWSRLDSVLVIRGLQERLSESSRELTRFRMAQEVGILAAHFLLDGRVRGEAVILAGNAPGSEEPAGTTQGMLRREAEELGLPVERDVRAAGEARERAATVIAPGWQAERERDLGIGSNAWVVGGRRSATGSPLLANDTHLRLETPSTFYLMDLEWPGQRVAGATIPGFPGVLIGRNRRIAWGVTILTADVRDYVIERRDPDRPDRYLISGPGGPHLPFETHQEIIRVKGKEAVVEKVLSTRHGPVVDPAWSETTVLVEVREWTPGLGALAAVRGYDLASDFAAFRAAAARHGRPAENLLYADVDGHVGYVAAGWIPLRRGTSGLLPVAGWRHGKLFAGQDPVEDRPFALDPADGFLVTANNRVMDGVRSERWNRAWPDADRAARAAELIRERPRHDAVSFRRMQGDTFSRRAQRIMEALEELRAAGAFEPAPRSDSEAAWSMLSRWEARYSSGPAPGLFALFWDRLKERAFADDVGESLSRSADMGLMKLLGVADVLGPATAAGEPSWWDDLSTPSMEEHLAEQVSGGLGDAWRMMRRKAGAGTKTWDWPQLHQARFMHPMGRDIVLLGRLLDGPSLPVAGAAGCLLATGCFPERSFDVVSLPALRMVADLSSGGGLRMVIPLGESGIPASPHYEDQALLWSAVSDLEIFPGGGSRADSGRVLLLEPGP